MVFVATDDVAENVRRVALRGLDGGHSASEPRLREIYRKSLANLPLAITVFDEVVLFDASAFDQRPQLVARCTGARDVFRVASLPRWCAQVLERLREP